MLKKSIHLLLFLTLQLSVTFSQPTFPQRFITDNDLQAGQSYTWSKDTVYILEDIVYLEEGGTLTIEPGTVIKAQEYASSYPPYAALVIARNARIFADGTPDEPIIFTTILDDITDKNDLSLQDKGLWGGLIILGNACINGYSDEEFFNGFFDDRGLYGADPATCNNSESSGSLSYISIRHSGFDSGDFPAPGLGLGGVGNETNIHHIEIIAGTRAIQISGGEVGLKHMMTAFCSRESFLWEKGWRGKGQFWFSIHGFEPDQTANHYGGFDTFDKFSSPTVYNVTYIGPGDEEFIGDRSLWFKEGTGGIYANSIFTEMAGFALEVTDFAANNNPDCRDRMLMGELSLKNNVWWNFASGNEFNAGPNGIIAVTPYPDDPNASFVIDHLLQNRNFWADPQLEGISYQPDGGLDPRAYGYSVFFELADYPQDDDFFQTVNYKGAFSTREDEFWPRGWTCLNELGFFPAASTDTIPNQVDSNLVVITYEEDITRESLDSLEQYIQSAFGAEKLKECWCTDSVPRIQLWGSNEQIEINTIRKGSKSKVDVDTTELNYALILDEPVDDLAINENCVIQPANHGTKNFEAKVAIIDSGIDMLSPLNDRGHSDLEDLILINPLEAESPEGVDADENCLSNDVAGFDFLNSSNRIEDKDGHGTHISGIVASDYPGDIELKIANLKIYELGEGILFDLFCAIHYAIDSEVDVINLSLGYESPTPSPTLYEALKRAQEEGIIVVISAGNDGEDNDKLNRWPGNFTSFALPDSGFFALDNLIVVAGLNGDQSDLGDYSNTGKTNVHVAAAGVVNSTFLNNSYETLQGTSMSAGEVTRLVSIIKAYKPKATYQEIIQCIEDATAMIPGGNQLKWGGKIDEAKTLECMGITVPESEAPSAQDIVLFPQPFRDQLRVRIIAEQNFENVNFNVFDQTGKQVHSSACQGRNLVWDGRDNNNNPLPAGLYICEFEIDGDFFVEKVLKF